MQMLNWKSHLLLNRSQFSCANNNRFVQVVVYINVRFFRQKNRVKKSGSFNSTDLNMFTFKVEIFSQYKRDLLVSMVVVCGARCITNSICCNVLKCQCQISYDCQVHHCFKFTDKNVHWFPQKNQICNFFRAHDFLNKDCVYICNTNIFHTFAKLLWYDF